MTKPTDDLEAVRIVAEALQGFDAGDQERIIRWAREKLGLVALPAQPPRPASVPAPVAPIARPTPPVAPVTPPAPPAVAVAPPAPPAAIPITRSRPIVERPVVEVPQAEQPVVEQLALEQTEVEQLDLEPSERQPAAVNMLVPAPEEKNRAFTVIGIILLAVAVVFLIVMIMTKAR
jgi:hypothetical protein